MGKQWKQWQTLFSWVPRSLWMLTSAMKLKDPCYDKPRQHTEKLRHQFADKGPYSQSYGFPVVMYECESWTIKEDWVLSNWCFWTMVMEKILKVPWTAKRSNQSILKEISPEYSLEGLMLKLKLQNFGHLMIRTDSLEKTLMLGKIEGRRKRGWQKMRWLDDITYLMDMRLSKLWEIVKDREALYASVHRVAKSWTEVSDWTIECFPFPTFYHHNNGSNIIGVGHSKKG